MTGIVFGCSVPHPPLLVPDIGRGQEKLISATSQAMEKLAEKLAQCHPQTVLIISPHGQYHSDAMGILTARSSTGDLSQWGSTEPQRHFDNNLEMVAAIEEEAKAVGIPIKPIGKKGYELDHGVMVPMHFLLKSVKGVPLVPLTFSWLPLSVHFAFGKAMGRAAERIRKRVAIVASGDLSHRLFPDAPVGYDPMGKAFDEKMVAALSQLDTQTILDLDGELIERAGECGLRSIVILLGALEGLEVKSEILSYEGPFGVGYVVATFEVVGKKELHPLVKLAKETVESYIREGKVVKPEERTAEMKQRAGVFVSLKKHGELRGCIGTFQPTKANVADEVIANAIESATGDPRFLPVRASELGDLEYSVDVLTKPEPVAGIERLDAKRYGVIVECGFRRGLLLPDLEGVDSVEQQIEICRAKGGILPEEPVNFYRFEVKRYK